MPTLISMRLDCGHQVEAGTARELLKLGCSLFERDEDHEAADKPFSAWPPGPDPVDPASGLVLRFAWLRSAAPPFDPEQISKVWLGPRICRVVDFTTQEEPFERL